MGGDTAGESQERKEFGKKKMGKEGESGLREKSVFLLLCDCVFHSILSPFQSTVPPLFFLHTHTHTTLYTAPSHTHHATQAHLCAALFLSLCVTVSALNPHSIKQHNTMQSCNHHNTQPMYDELSEWERAVVIEDTTPQTPSTTMK